jgi:predicted GIY-YIG superfamily endonuclease
MRGVYLIHFNTPYKHAKHYLGYSQNIGERIIQHELNQGARLMQVVNDAGLEWKVSRVWLDGSRQLERSLKGRGKSRICPICNPKIVDHNNQPDYCIISRLHKGVWTND